MKDNNTRAWNFKDLTNQQFGKLVVKEYLGLNTKSNSLWKCICICGNEKIVPTYYLTSGDTGSCGKGECRPTTLAKGMSAKNAVISGYKNIAKKNGRVFELTNEQCYELFDSNCFYCGSTPDNVYQNKRGNGPCTYNGIDRVDNTKSYTKDNCVACCIICNRSKRELTKEEFFAWIQKICKHQSLTDC